MSANPNIFDNSKVHIQDIPKRGRGVVAATSIDQGELIVSAPILVLSGIEYYLMRILPCIMHTFSWDRPEARGGDTAAIAFGLVSLCNHSEDGANADAVRVYDEERIDLVALHPIEAGEEILIRYKSVPFDPA